MNTKETNPICGHATWCACGGKVPSPHQLQKEVNDVLINSDNAGVLEFIRRQVSHIRECPQDKAVYSNFQENALEYVEFLLTRVKP